MCYFNCSQAIMGICDRTIVQAVCWSSFVRCFKTASDAVFLIKMNEIDCKLLICLIVLSHFSKAYCCVGIYEDCTRARFVSGAKSLE
jgi:hypothetical protein